MNNHCLKHGYYIIYHHSLVYRHLTGHLSFVFGADEDICGGMALKKKNYMHPFWNVVSKPNCHLSLLLYGKDGMNATFYLMVMLDDVSKETTKAITIHIL